MPSRATVILLGIGAFASPMDALRAGPVGAMADAALLLAMAVIGLRWTSAPARVRAGPFIGVFLGASLLALGGLIGTFFSVVPGESLVNLSRFTATGCLLPVAVAAARLPRAAAQLLLWAYVCGAASNSLGSFLELNPVTGRADGWSSHPNVLGLSSAFALVLLAGLRETTGHDRRWPAVALSGVLLAGVMRSGSRAALVVLVVGVLVYVLSRRRYHLALAGAAASVLALTLLLGGLYTPEPTSALGRVLTRNESTIESNAERDLLEQAVIDRINEHPATGTGFGFATQAHNIYLQVVDIGGPLGLIGFCVMASWIVHVLARCRRVPVVAGALGMYVGYLAGGAVVNTLWDRWLWVPVILGLAATSGSATLPEWGSPIPVTSGRRTVGNG